MDTAVTILRELWSRRIVVGAFGLVAILVGALVAYQPSLPPKSRNYQVGTAIARILVDTPASQVVEVAPKGSETLGTRASLLANLMADGEVKAAIAKRAGLDPDRLLTVTPAAIEPTAITESELRNPRANILTIRVLTNDAGEQLPIIDIDAQAIDAGHAATLANAAVTGLEEYLDSKATDDQVADAKRLRVRPLGEALGRDEARGPSKVLALMAACFIFATLCAILLLLGALARGWRAASEEEELGEALHDWQLEAAFYDEGAVPGAPHEDDSPSGDAEVEARSA